MSATGRGAERSKADYYPTPAKAVHQLLRAVPLPGGRWLEPGAGDGAIIRAVDAYRDDVRWSALELQATMKPRLLKTGAYVDICNFLRHPLPAETYDVALGNPPFSLADRFVLRALGRADEVVFLLRLNWLGSSRKRRHVFTSAGVPDVFVLEDRPSFVGVGTDACDYGWMRWRRGGQKGRLSILRGDQ